MVSCIALFEFIFKLYEITRGPPPMIVRYVELAALTVIVLWCSGSDWIYSTNRLKVICLTGTGSRFPLFDLI